MLDVPLDQRAWLLGSFYFSFLFLFIRACAVTVCECLPAVAHHTNWSGLSLCLLFKQRLPCRQALRPRAATGLIAPPPSFMSRAVRRAPGVASGLGQRSFLPSVRDGTGTALCAPFASDPLSLRPAVDLCLFRSTTTSAAGVCCWLSLGVIFFFDPWRLFCTLGSQHALPPQIW